jgi:glycosyltransferase involved in cell wall biosynthesis
MSDIIKKEPITVKLNSKNINLRPPKIKVLWYSDFLRHTGFGNVAEEILSRLNETGKYKFAVLGINHMGQPYNIPSSDYYYLKDIPVWPASALSNDLFGFTNLAGMLATQKFDLFFALQDSFNMINMADSIKAAKRAKNFKYIYYFPVDGDLHEEWVKNGVAVADYPVSYTEYGKKKVFERRNVKNLRVINHGVDPTKFYPVQNNNERKKIRANIFGIASDDTFLITNVNRNQPRKDLPRTILAFKEFCRLYPEIDAKLYLHCHLRDIAGHDLKQLSKLNVPKKLFEEKMMLPNTQGFGENGVPLDILRQMYQASDVITSNTIGEGWGLSTTEAMACKVPVAIPNNTATTEIIGKNNERGYLIKSGGDPNLYTAQRQDNDLIRPLTDIHDQVRIWKHIYDNKQEAAQKAEKAYKWVMERTWDIIADKWDKLFMEAYNSLNKK